MEGKMHVAGYQMITAEEVIAKLKDDGDFDTLRLKIIRKLKENEDLRNSIISAIKQSEVFNCPSSESLKPRQLSDAIHREIGSKLMSQISDGVWAVIRSADGMKNEVTETVQSVYNKLVDPKGKVVEDDLSAVPTDQQVGDKEMVNTLATCKQKPGQSEPMGPQGSSQCDSRQCDGGQEECKEPLQESQPNEQPVKEPHGSPGPDILQPSSDEPSEVALAESVMPKRKDGDGEEDPDVPPGFE